MTEWIYGLYDIVCSFGYRHMGSGVLVELGSQGGHWEGGVGQDIPEFRLGW